MGVEPSPMTAPVVRIGPQPGPQTEFLATLADVAIFGGGAGGGKTYGLLLEPTRHFDNPLFGGVIFRKEAVQIRNQGSLWDESAKLFPLFGAAPRESTLEWMFPHPTDPSRPGCTMKFAGLERDSTCLNWQGSQIPYIGFDELTHFTEYQFFYMLSRIRSDSGVPGYVRATCNPDVNSWLRKFLDWWIGKDGLALPERSGVIRYFIRINEEIIWADSKEDLYLKYGRGPEIMPLSVTFIPSTVYDNKILMQKDPGYLGKLLALPRVERERLLGGNWNVKASAGTVFRREWFEVIEALPADCTTTVRYWDRAATIPNENNKDPDWTRGVKVAKTKQKQFIVCGMVSARTTPLHVEALVKNTASQDGRRVVQCIEQDPGSAGVADAQNFARVLAGYQVRIRKPTKDKLTRALPASAQAEAGNIKVLSGPWNDAFFQELENFSEALEGHDDIVDAFSGAFNELCTNPSILDVL